MEVELKPPPSDGNTKSPKKKCRYTRDPGMFWVGVATFIVVAIYACFARQQAIATEAAVNAAKQSADVAQRTLESTQRAYLVAREPRVALNGEIRVPISNLGHVSARVSSVVIHLIKGNTVELRKWKKESNESQDVPPGGLEGNAIFINPPNSFLQRVPGATISITINGEVIYDIGFSKLDKYDFCFSYNPSNSQWAWCGSGTGLDMREVPPTTERNTGQ